MRVKDFTRLGAGALYEVVDATRVGYMTRPAVLMTADRSVVDREHGDKELVAFAPKTKTTVTIYVKG